MVNYLVAGCWLAVVLGTGLPVWRRCRRMGLTTAEALSWVMVPVGVFTAAGAVGTLVIVAAAAAAPVVGATPAIAGGLLLVVLITAALLAVRWLRWALARLDASDAGGNPGGT